MLHTSHVSIPVRKSLHDYSGGAPRDTVVDRHKRKTVDTEHLQRLLDAGGRGRTS
jgi:hypothetical protein